MSNASLLLVDLRPGLPALNGVLSVLAARAAVVGAMTYASCDSGASLRIRVDGPFEHALRLAAQVERRIDVLSVAVTAGAA